MFLLEIPGHGLLIQGGIADDTGYGSLAPYEKRVIELIRNGKDKRARKLAKKRVWTTEAGEGGGKRLRD